MELTARSVEGHSFSSSMRGYDREEVHAYLAQVAGYLSHLEEERAISNARAARIQKELDRINDILETRIREASQARTTLLDEARREADRIIATATESAGRSGDVDATTTAAAIISEAETRAEIRLQEVEAILEQARQEARQISREATQTAELKLAEADRVLEAARRQSRDQRRATEADRIRLERQLEQVRMLLESAADGRDLAGAIMSIDNDELVVDLREPATQTASASPTTDS